MTRRYPIESVLNNNQFTYQAYASLQGKTTGFSTTSCEIVTNEEEWKLYVQFTIAGQARHPFQQLFAIMLTPGYNLPGFGVESAEIPLITPTPFAFYPNDASWVLSTSDPYNGIIRVLYNEGANKFRVTLNDAIIKEWDAAFLGLPTSWSFLDLGAFGGTITDVILGT